MRAAWTVRLATTAEADFQGIIEWTADQFGDSQARAYSEVLRKAFVALSAGPDAIGAKGRSELGRNHYTLHKGRHFILFKVANAGDQGVVEIIRLLHDTMDLARHIPEAG